MSSQVPFLARCEARRPVARGAQAANLRLLLNAKVYAGMPVALMPGNVGVTFGVVNAAAPAGGAPAGAQEVRTPFPRRRAAALRNVSCASVSPLRRCVPGWALLRAP